MQLCQSSTQFQFPSVLLSGHFMVKVTERNSVGLVVLSSMCMWVMNTTTLFVCTYMDELLSWNSKLAAIATRFTVGPGPACALTTFSAGAGHLDRRDSLASDSLDSAALSCKLAGTPLEPH